MPLSLKAASISLLAALLVYPFTIAGSNFFFAIVLLISMFKKEVMLHGLKIAWQQYRPISIGILLFIAFNFIGSFWGPLNELAFHKMGKQLNWLIIPAIVGLTYINSHLKKHAFIAVSIGLSLHMIAIVLQAKGIWHIQELGSSHDDPAGFIGHLSLGFIHGIWAGALLIATRFSPKKWKPILYLLAICAVFTVFIAQGRSGYITTIACLALVIFKVFYPRNIRIKLALLSLLLVLIGLFIANHEPTRTKILRTVHGVSSFFHGNWEHVDMRIQIWAVSLDVWKLSPWLGVGTGGYPDAAKKVLDKPSTIQTLKIAPQNKSIFYGHPHNEYLFELSRWGPLGLLALLYLLWHWFYTGWKLDWEKKTMTAYLFTASGLSVFLHGFTEPSLNTQTSTVFAILVLGFAMSNTHCQPNTT